MQSQNFIGGNLVVTKAGLTGLSGAATTFTTAAAVVAAIYGKAYSKAAVAGGATPTTDAVTGAAITLVAGKGTVVLWCVDAAGNIKVVQGTTELLDQANNFQFAAPNFPAALPDTLVPFAYSIHKAGHPNSAVPLGAGVTWTFGVSNWNVTGMSHAAQDILMVPNRPQVS